MSGSGGLLMMQGSVCFAADLDLVNYLEVASHPPFVMVDEWKICEDKP